MRSVKRLICFCTAVIMILSWCVSASDFIEYREFQAALGRAGALLTTHDGERYIRFTTDGNVIHAEGYFSDAIAQEFYISTATLRGMTGEFVFTSDGADGGSFEASFGGVPDELFARAVIRFADGGLMSWRVEYNAEIGWFFGDNGISMRTREAVENYYVISADISEYYISATRDPDELRQTRELLRVIVREVTGGMQDDYQKAKALNRWVAENIYYDRDARDTEVTEDSVSVARTLELRRSVCIGIINTYIALLEAAGIKAVNIKGGIVSPAEGVPYELLGEKTVPHEWAAFWYEAEERWVYADPTWDRQGFFVDGEYDTKPPVIKYFDVTGFALSLDHRGDKAELRHFMEQATDNNETEGSQEPVAPMIINLPPPASEPVMLEDDNTVLFLAIGAMSLVAAVLIYVIIKLRR